MTPTRLLEIADLAHQTAVVSQNYSTGRSEISREIFQNLNGLTALVFTQNELSPELKQLIPAEELGRFYGACRYLRDEGTTLSVDKMNALYRHLGTIEEILKTAADDITSPSPQNNRSSEIRSTVEDSHMATPKLFLSHASSDKPLVQAFVNLLEGGVGVSFGSIFCSSLKGQGIRPGTDFKSSIRQSLDDATCVVALISPNFYGSPFCMCELGGVWIQAKSFLPVLVPPLEFGHLKAVLSGLQASKISEPEDLDELRDEIVSRLSINEHPTPRWNQRRDEFLKTLPDILEQLPNLTPIMRETHDKVLKELDECRLEHVKSQDQIKRLNEIIADLKKVKGSKKATAVVQKHSSDSEDFHSLVHVAKDTLIPLPSIVQEALYYRARGEDYYPKSHEHWDEVQRPIEEGQLELNAEENGVCPSNSDPRVRKAMDAIDALQEWLDSAPVEFFELYNEEFDGRDPDITLRPFWEEHLL